MRKLIKFFTFLSLFSLCGCSSLGPVEEFGDAEVLNDEFPGSVDWFRVENKYYIFVGEPTKLAQKKTAKTLIAAFNDDDHFSYKIYSLNDYENILLINYFSKVNLVNDYAVYTYENHDYVAGELIDDFPHKDTLFNGGLEATINNKKYSFFGYANQPFEVGNQLPFTYNSRACFELDEDGWIAVTSKNSGPDNYDLFYEVNTVNKIPVKYIVAGAPIVKR